MIPDFQVTVQAQPAQEFLDAVAKQVPFALSLGLNRTALAVQEAEKQGIDRRFIIRQPWVPEQIKFTKDNWATKDNPVATLTIDQRAGFLLKFEDGGVKAMQPNRFGLIMPFALPTQTLRPDFAGSVPRADYPRALGLLSRLDPSGRLIQAGKGPRSRRQAERRKYFLMAPGGQTIGEAGGGVWMRYGSGAGLHRGADAIVFLWKFKSQITVKPILQFKATTDQVIGEQFDAIFTQAMSEAVATAK